MEQLKSREAQRNVRITSGNEALDGNLAVPAGASGLVLFAHGSGSSRLSPRNVFVARALQEAGVGTLLFDLLSRAEEQVDLYTREHRFDIGLLAQRLVHATAWVDTQDELRDLRVGYFGASTGSAAALVAAARLEERVSAVVSRGGRPDLAAAELARVRAPTLLIVGGDDDVVIELNEQAYRRLQCEKHLTIVPGASHLFEEPGTLEQVAQLASEWFRRHLGSAS
ncbi:MAG TPA: dienelactone hydrolase family protein [Burkholderiales bacterium]|nr:dienelactone hydrolase family protein [Burkholderiales bacterium]